MLVTGGCGGLFVLRVMFGLGEHIRVQSLDIVHEPYIRADEITSGGNLFVGVLVLFHRLGEAVADAIADELHHFLGQAFHGPRFESLVRGSDDRLDLPGGFPGHLGTGVTSPLPKAACVVLTTGPSIVSQCPSTRPVGPSQPSPARKTATDMILTVCFPFTPHLPFMEKPRTSGTGRLPGATWLIVCFLFVQSSCLPRLSDVHPHNGKDRP